MLLARTWADVWMIQNGTAIEGSAHKHTNTHTHLLPKLSSSRANFNAIIPKPKAINRSGGRKPGYEAALTSALHVRLFLSHYVHIVLCVQCHHWA